MDKIDSVCGKNSKAYQCLGLGNGLKTKEDGAGYSGKVLVLHQDSQQVYVTDLGLVMCADKGFKQ